MMPIRTRMMLVIIAAALLILLVSEIAVADGIAVSGAPSDAALATVRQGLARFTPAEQATVRRVVFADAGYRGRLRVPGDYHLVNVPYGPGWTVCGEPWTDPWDWVVLVDDPVHCPLTEDEVAHEVCHRVVGEAHWHDAVWAACFTAHGGTP